MPIEPVVVEVAKGDDPPKATLYYGQDCRESLRQLPDQSVHTVCTSPPYWGLRDYGNDPSVWGGDKDCDHEWGDTIPGSNKGGSGTPTDKNNRGEGYGRGEPRGQYCTKCNAWMGQLGLEPAPTCPNPASNEMMLELRDDLTEAEKNYVFGELLRRGIVR